MPQEPVPQEERLERIERVLNDLRRDHAELLRAVRGLERLLAAASPVWRAIYNAPPDDEPYTAEQQRADVESFASVLRGEGASHEDLMREFGVPE